MGQQWAREETELASAAAGGWPGADPVDQMPDVDHVERSMPEFDKGMLECNILSRAGVMVDALSYMLVRPLLLTNVMHTCIHSLQGSLMIPAGFWQQ